MAVKCGIQAVKRDTLLLDAAQQSLMLNTVQLLTHLPVSLQLKVNIFQCARRGNDIHLCVKPAEVSLLTKVKVQRTDVCL